MQVTSGLVEESEGIFGNRGSSTSVGVHTVLACEHSSDGGYHEYHHQQPSVVNIPTMTTLHKSHCLCKCVIPSILCSVHTFPLFCRTMQAVFMDEMCKPLKQFIDEHNKARKSAEEVVQKAFKGYTEKKSEDTKVRRTVVVVFQKGHSVIHLG